MMGIRTETTIPALFVLESVFFLLLTCFGAGLNILGRISMPEISRIKTRISLTPVKGFSFALGFKSSYISKIGLFVNSIQRNMQDNPMYFFVMLTGVIIFFLKKLI